MSWEAAGWAMEVRGVRTSQERLLLLVLADYADPERNLCWPSVENLAETCVMSQGSVVSCLQDLESMGLITRVQQGNQDQASIYQINVS